jgi:hypothetical protein
MGVPFVLILFTFLNSSSGYPLRSVETIQTSGTVSYFPKLKGINIFVDDWMSWSYSEIDQQVADVANAGFNFVRTGIYFAKFYDFATEQVNRTKGAWAYDQTVHFLNALKANGLLVSVVPMETNELSQLQNEYWYSDSYYQSVLHSYYYNFARWCYQMGWNIVYMSVWWEPISSDNWHDGAYSLQNSLSNFAEADNDWKTYCAEHNYTVADLSMTGSQPIQWRPTLWYYDNWSRQVFNEVTQIKAEAVKQGFPGMLVGGEIGLVGDPYNADEWTAQFYLGAIENQSRYPNKVVVPSLCAEPYVDVLELHDYFDSVQTEVASYLSYPTSKIKVMAECGPSDYSTSGPDNLTSWWNMIEPKMDAFGQQAGGFAYWAWKDYDARHLGLEDINFNPRPALTTISTWMKTS